jgi:hypothetical protein
MITQDGLSPDATSYRFHGCCICSMMLSLIAERYENLIKWLRRANDLDNAVIYYLEGAKAGIRLDIFLFLFSILFVLLLFSFIVPRSSINQEFV